MKKLKKINIVCCASTIGVLAAMGSINASAEYEPYNDVKITGCEEIAADSADNKEQYISYAEISNDLTNVSGEESDIITDVKPTAGNDEISGGDNQECSVNQEEDNNAGTDGSDADEAADDSGNKDDTGIDPDKEDNNQNDEENAGNNDDNPGKNTDENPDNEDDEGENPVENPDKEDGEDEKPVENPDNEDNEGEKPVENPDNEDENTDDERLYDISWYNEETDSFFIQNKQQLWGFSMLVNGLTKEYDEPVSFENKKIEIGNHISLENEKWIPVGQESTPFAGVFSGGGNTISRFNVEGTEEKYSGFFGYVTGKITDLSIAYADVNGGIAAGIAAGCLSESGVISNVNVSGNVSKGNNNGGLAGLVCGKIEASVNNANVSASKCAGGIAAVLENDGIIKDCFNFKTSLSVELIKIVSDNYAGGIAGACEGTIENCSNSSEVSAAGASGGICGYAENCGINTSFSTGSVSTESGNSGGIVGEGKNLKISYCYNTAKPQNKGGLSGGIAALLTDSSVEKCFSYFDYNEAENIYPIVKYDESDTVSVCFYNELPENEKNPNSDGDDAGGDETGKLSDGDDSGITEEQPPVESGGENEDAVIAGEAVKEDLFKSGELSWMLNTSNGSMPNEKKWGCNSKYPVLADSDNKAVFKVNTVYNENGGSLVAVKNYGAEGTLIQLKVSNELKYKLADLWMKGEETKVETDIAEYPYYIYMPQEDVTVYAVFEKNSGSHSDENDEDKDDDKQDEDTDKPARYTVLFDAVDGVFYKDTDKECSTIEKQVSDGRRVSKPENPVMEGYVFKGWSLNPHGDEEYDFTDGVTEDFTLYAIYSHVTNFTVTFDLNGGKGSTPRTQNINEGEYIENPGEAQWEDNTKAFGGWTSKKNDEKSVWNFEKDKMPGENIVLYALWVENDIDFNGLGVKSSPYLLESDEDILKLSEKVASGETYEGRYFQVEAADLVCSKSIGSSLNPFMGFFDGAGYAIELDISSEKDYQGLFGYIREGSVENVRVTGKVSGKNYVGAVAGYVSEGSVSGCESEAEVCAEESYVGGIVGYGAANESENRGNVSGIQYVGGIAGRASGNMSGCSNSGKVTAKGGYAGGIAGDGVKCSFDNCENSGQIEITGSETGGDENAYTGGIAGILESANNCYNSGDVTGFARTGGIAGRITSKLESCVNTGNIRGTVRTGGIAGSAAVNSVLTYCSSDGGSVFSGSYAGGICGDCENNSVIEYSFCLDEVTSEGSYCGGISAKGGIIKNSFCYNKRNAGCVIANGAEIYASYYLADDDTEDEDFKAPAKSAAAFENGMVSWLLNTDGGGKFALNGNSMIWTVSGGIPAYANGDGIIAAVTASSTDAEILVDGEKMAFCRQNDAVCLSYSNSDEYKLDDFIIKDYWTDAQIERIAADASEQDKTVTITGDVVISGSFTKIDPEEDKKPEEDNKPDSKPDDGSNNTADDNKKPNETSGKSRRPNNTFFNAVNGSDTGGYRFDIGSGTGSASVGVGSGTSNGRIGSVSGGTGGGKDALIESGSAGADISASLSNNGGMTSHGVKTETSDTESNVIERHGSNVISDNSVNQSETALSFNSDVSAGKNEMNKAEPEYAERINSAAEAVSRNAGIAPSKGGAAKKVSRLVADRMKLPEEQRDRHIGVIALIAALAGFTCSFIFEKRRKKG